LGNPNNGLDASEPFAYLNFFATNTSELFNKIVIHNNNVFSGFESDNHSIVEGLLSTPYPGQEVSSIPEPTTIIIWSLLGGLAITVSWWRQKRLA
jgi:hypothetical protein